MKTEKKLESLYKTYETWNSQEALMKILQYMKMPHFQISRRQIIKCCKPNFLKLKSGLIVLQKEHPYVPTSNF